MAEIPCETESSPKNHLKGLPYPMFKAWFQGFIEEISTGFTLEHAERVKDIEAVTNHDVKAVEYFVKERLAESSPFICFDFIII